MSMLWRQALIVIAERRAAAVIATSSNVRFYHASFPALDLFSELRLKAANVLTSGLSTDDRRKIMQRLDDSTINNNGDDDEDEPVGGADVDSSENINNIIPQKTIGEAVAAARMEEAQRQERKWESEKDKLLQDAEEAARARVESDLMVQERRLAMERWQRDLEAEKKRKAEGMAVATESNATAAPAVVVDNDEESTGENAQPNENVHPILGPVLHDFGYKKVYQVSANTLATIPVWKKQRLYRHERAKVIAADKAKTAHLGLPGILVLHEDKNGKLSILDGQHRVGAMAVLSEKSPNAFDLENILVEVFTSSGDEDLAEEIFIEINKSEPIKLVDMPGVAKAADRKVITESAALLQERYPDMFKPSQQCRVPHLNIDNLRDALFAAQVLKKHNLKTSATLVNWMTAQNELLAQKFQDASVAETVNARALAKAQKYDFYLGLDSSWLYN